MHSTGHLRRVLKALATIAMGHLSTSTPHLPSLQLLRQVLLLEHTALPMAPEPMWQLLVGCGAQSNEALTTLVVAVIDAYAEIRQLPALLAALLASVDIAEGGGVAVLANATVLTTLAQRGMWSPVAASCTTKKSRNHHDFFSVKHAPTGQASVFVEVRSNL